MTKGTPVTIYGGGMRAEPPRRALIKVDLSVITRLEATQLAQVYRLAREIVANGLARHYFARAKNGLYVSPLDTEAVKWDMYGAMTKAARDLGIGAWAAEPDEDLNTHAESLLRDCLPADTDVFEFSDRAPKAEILAAFDAAIEKAETMAATPTPARMANR